MPIAMAQYDGATSGDFDVRTPCVELARLQGEVMKLLVGVVEGRHAKSRAPDGVRMFATLFIDPSSRAAG